jgi:hypothetical protein
MFPPDLFPPALFPPDMWNGRAAAPPASVLGPGRDRDVFQAIKATLVGTQAFDAVLLHQAINHARTTADRNPIVTIRRTGWNEADLYDPTCFERTVSYDLTIALRMDDPEERFAALERLEDIAVNALDGQTLAGICVRHKTAIARGQDDPEARDPEQRVTLKGQFAYLFDGYAGRTTSA